MEKPILTLNPNAKSSGTAAKASPVNRGNRKEVIVHKQARGRYSVPKTSVPKTPFKQKKPPVSTVPPVESKVPDEDREGAKHQALQNEKKRREEALRLQAEQEAKRIVEAKKRKEKEAEEQQLAETPDPAPEPFEAKPPAEIPTEPAKPKAAPAKTPTGKSNRKRFDQTPDPKPPGKDTRDNRRNKSKKVDVRALDDDDVQQRSQAAYRRSQQKKRHQAKTNNEVREKIVRDVQIPESITVQELANRMAERVADVIKCLFENKIMATQNQPIDADTAEFIVETFGHKFQRVSASDVEDVIETKPDLPEELASRPPVVSIMGHVDHGKTSLLDTIRKTNVASGEAGGITQHIGAYRVKSDDGQLLTFIDTPGHAAFTAMRARGAQVTDIVILVVAADDAVMPQTAEAISHAQAANVPMLIAINKCDLPGADPNKVRNDLLRHNVIVEAHSGDVLDVEISALNGTGIDQLLDAIALQAEVLELKANPNRIAEGAVIESRLDIGRGPVATILVQNGTLRKGDIFVVGDQWGKVRALIDDTGARINSAGPSTPVEVLGLNGPPQAGDTLNVVETEAQAREISRYRQDLVKQKDRPAGTVISLDTLLGIRSNETKDLDLVVKADVQGSVEAIVQGVEKIGNDEVKVRVLHSGVGAITETDVSLAEASNARIIGFNVRANAPARVAAANKGINISYYSVIYSLVDDIRAYASDLLSPEIKETIIGNAEILEIFKVTGSGTVAGCRVSEGIARKTAGVRLLRDNTIIHEGKLKTLKRFKEDVPEVRSGLECGMAFENYSNLRKGDFIEVFERLRTPRSL